MAVFDNNINDNHYVCTNLLEFFLHRAPFVYKIEYLSAGETSQEELEKICVKNQDLIGRGHIAECHTLFLQNEIRPGTVLSNEAEDAEAYREIRLMESERMLDKSMVEYRVYLVALMRVCLLELGLQEDSYNVYRAGLTYNQPDGSIITTLMAVDVTVGQGEEVAGHYLVLHYSVRHRVTTTTNTATRDYYLHTITPAMLTIWQNAILHELASEPARLESWRARFGIHFADQFSKTSLVVTLQRPCIEFNKNGAAAGDGEEGCGESRNEPLNGQWRMQKLRDHSMKKSPPIERWKLLFPQDEHDRLISPLWFARLLQDEAKTIGLTIHSPDVIITRLDEELCALVRQVLMSGRDENRPQLIMAVLPEWNESIFASFKRACKANNVTSQCFYAGELQNDATRLLELIRRLSYICVSINVKNGGIPLLVRVDTIVSDGIMFGISVKREENSNDGFLFSYVASTDIYDIATFSSDTVRCANLEQLHFQFEQAIIFSIRERKRPLPKSIFIYGDDFAVMIEDDFKNKIQAMYASMGTDLPTVACVRVLDRTSLQVYPSPRQDDGNGLRVGTVIEMPGFGNEFYLLSEPFPSQVVQPSRYIIHMDTGNLGKSIIEENTLALCHLYYDDHQFDDFKSTSCPFHLKLAMQNIQDYLCRE